eukprot:COSAG02_NODE_275_length_26232_cov_85.210424_5_plen_102_part_00
MRLGATPKGGIGPQHAWVGSLSGVGARGLTVQASARCRLTVQGSAHRGSVQHPVHTHHGASPCHLRRVHGSAAALRSTGVKIENVKIDHSRHQALQCILVL